MKIPASISLTVQDLKSALWIIRTVLHKVLMILCFVKVTEATAIQGLCSKWSLWGYLLTFALLCLERPPSLQPVLCNRSDGYLYNGWFTVKVGCKSMQVFLVLNLMARGGAMAFPIHCIRPSSWTMMKCHPDQEVSLTKHSLQSFMRKWSIKQAEKLLQIHVGGGKHEVHSCFKYLYA